MCKLYIDSVTLYVQLDSSSTLWWSLCRRCIPVESSAMRRTRPRVPTVISRLSPPSAMRLEHSPGLSSPYCALPRQCTCLVYDLYTIGMGGILKIYGEKVPRYRAYRGTCFVNCDNIVVSKVRHTQQSIN